MDYYFDEVQGAIASDGTAAVAFRKGQQATTNIRVRSAATGEWGKREFLTRAADDPVLVAAQTGGSVAAVWFNDDSSQLVIRRHDANGWRRARRVVVPADGGVEDVEMNARGDVAVVIQDTSGAAVLAAVSPAHGPWTVEPLLSGSMALLGVRALLADSGQLTVVATEHFEGEDWAIVVGRLTPTHQWVTTRLAPEEHDRVSDVTAKVGPNGTIGLVWVESNFDEGLNQVVIDAAGPDGTFEPRRVLAGSGTRECWYPDRCADIGFAAGDRLVLVWSTGSAGSGVLASERSSDGTWSDPVSIPVDESASVDLVAVNQDGFTIAQTALEFVSCRTLTTCKSINAPAGWPQTGRYSWIQAGPTGSAYAIYGAPLCSGRCLGRPYWSSWSSH